MLIWHMIEIIYGNIIYKIYLILNFYLIKYLMMKILLNIDQLFVDWQNKFI